MKNQNTIKKKFSELKQALKVIEKIEESISWACDFTSFSSIANALNPVYDAADKARDVLEEELEYLENQVDEYNFKLAEFEEENEINYERDNY